MTNKQIDEILALEAKATPGPWFEQYEYDGSRTVAQMRSTDTLMCINRATHVDGHPWERTKENARLIAAVRNNIRELCEEVKRLRDNASLSALHKNALGECAELILDSVEQVFDITAPGGRASSRQAIMDAVEYFVQPGVVEMKRLRGTIAADDERLRIAGERTGLPFGCDTAEHMADELLSLREEVKRLREFTWFDRLDSRHKPTYVLHLLNEGEISFAKACEWLRAYAAGNEMPIIEAPVGDIPDDMSFAETWAEVKRLRAALGYIEKAIMEGGSQGRTIGISLNIAREALG